MVKVIPTYQSWLFSAIYASTDFSIWSSNGENLIFFPKATTLNGSLVVTLMKSFKLGKILGGEVLVAIELACSRIALTRVAL